jgi:antitoxin VapB
MSTTVAKNFEGGSRGGAEIMQKKPSIWGSSDFGMLLYPKGESLARTYPDLAILRSISYIRVMTKEIASMAIAESRTFRSGNSEAVRLPRNVAFGREVELTIVRSGDVLTIYPARKPIGELAKQLVELARPSEIEVRDDEVLPEPSGR